MIKENFDWLVYWINERHRIYLKREAGEPYPWTNDKILQEWKFCNPFRQNDKQTKLLQEHVIQPHWEADPALLLFNIFAFRAFNWWPTYEVIGGWQEEWEPEKVKIILHDYVEKDKQKLTSGAYMIRGKEGLPKWVSIVDSLIQIKNRCPTLIRMFPRYGFNGRKFITLEAAYMEIVESYFWGWSEFTSYQIVLDLLYSPILKDASDVNDWCAFGPGAKKGLRHIWPDIELSKSEMITATRELLEYLPRHLEPHVPQLNLQDVEFSLCELNKYLRILHGGKGKTRYAQGLSGQGEVPRLSVHGTSTK